MDLNPTNLKPESFFFERTGLNQMRTEKVVFDLLHGVDDGELFLEYGQSESIIFDDGRLYSTSFNTNQGFGLRAILGEACAYAHISEISDAALQRAANTIKAAKSGYAGTWSAPPRAPHHKLYTDMNPIDTDSFANKVNLLSRVDAYARAYDPRVKQVSLSINSSWKTIAIIRPDHNIITDNRPFMNLHVSVSLEQNGRMETGTYGYGSRENFFALLADENWKTYVQEATRQAEVNLTAQPAPAGEMTVVLGSGWPAVILHEAVGHGLEGDAIRKNTSIFSSLKGERVAAPGVTVIDDGTLAGRTGSLNIDDEGTPTQRNVLIEDGILKNFMYDRMNGRLCQQKSTGSGRRQNYSYAPLPRMTNTFMLAGEQTPDEIIKSVKKGIYTKDLNGGQVDITNGKFVFNCSESYLIENGKITMPIKSASLIGNGPDIMKKISAVGNDMLLDNGIGMCGKQGQSLPVGVGQPTIRVDGVTVGGTL